MAFRIPLTGLIAIHGDQDSGKTTFALENGASPDKIMFVDADVKGRSTMQQMLADGIQLGRYEDWTNQTKNMKEVAAFEHGISIIDSVKPGQFDAIIWDVWSSFSKVMKAEVAAHPRKYRDNYSSMGTIKGAEENAAANDLESKLIADLLTKAPMVLLVTHLKPYYINNKRVDGKFVPDCKVSLVTKSRMRLWLRRNPSGRPVPVGLVLKRIDKKILVDGRVRTINILPQRLVPRPEDQSLWDLIEFLWEHPWGDRNQDGADAMNEYELSILDGTLTQDQKIAMRMALLELEEESAEAQAILTGRSQPEARPDEDIIAEIRTMLEQTNDEIRTVIPDATLPLILKARKA